jgi:hypothetical protein
MYVSPDQPFCPSGDCGFHKFVDHSSNMYGDCAAGAAYFAFYLSFRQRHNGRKKNKDMTAKRFRCVSYDMYNSGPTKDGHSMSRKRPRRLCCGVNGYDNYEEWKKIRIRIGTISASEP